MSRENPRDSRFQSFMRTAGNKRTFLWEGFGCNNGDRLILMGVQRVLQESHCTLVDKPEAAEQVLMNGGGRFQDAFPGNFEAIARYRRDYSSVPLIMAPQVFRVQNVNFKEICEISSSPFVLFARDHISETSLRRADLPAHCQILLSQDPAFELVGSQFIADLRRTCSERHVLVAMRKDEPRGKDEMVAARILARARGTWLPRRVRRPLSWMRDRLVARLSKGIIGDVLKQEGVPRRLPKIYRDISSSVTFEEFTAAICGAALIVTDRMHVAICGHLLGKRVIVVCSPGWLGEKLKGVYEYSMSGPDSRTSLYMGDTPA